MPILRLTTKPKPSPGCARRDAHMTTLSQLEWALIAQQIENGEDPDLNELATALRRGDDGVPRVMREYLAGLLDGSIQRKRGRKKDLSPRRRMEDMRLKYMVARYEANYLLSWQAQGIKPTYARDAALERLSEETGIPKDTLDKR